MKENSLFLTQMVRKVCAKPKCFSSNLKLETNYKTRWWSYNDLKVYVFQRIGEMAFIEGNMHAKQCIDIYCLTIAKEQSDFLVHI